MTDWTPRPRPTHARIALTDEQAALHRAGLWGDDRDAARAMIADGLLAVEDGWLTVTDRGRRAAGLDELHERP